MVDHYTQLFFTRVSLLNPHGICKTLNLCQPLLASQGNCEACHDTVSQLVTKLKDPQTKVCSPPLLYCFNRNSQDNYYIFHCAAQDNSLASQGMQVPQQLPGQGTHSYLN